MKVLIADLDGICNGGIDFLPKDPDKVHALYSNTNRQLPMHAVQIISHWSKRGILSLECFGSAFDRDREKLIRKLIFLAGYYSSENNDIEIITEDGVMRELCGEHMALTGYRLGPYKVSDPANMACTVAHGTREKRSSI